MNSPSPKDLITKIKSGGFWEINVRPASYVEDRIKREMIKGILRGAVVELRGWDYPHFNGEDNRPPYPIQDGIENWVHWQNHLEFWRMTSSGNFFHLLALREDWTETKEYRNMWTRGNELEDKKVLGVLGTLYTLTEIFEFGKRLAHQGVFDDVAVIDIKLYNLDSRSLIVDSYNRVPFSYDRVSRQNLWSPKIKEYLVNELLTKADEFALNAFKELIWLFDWEHPPVESLKNDQEKFLRGKL